VCDCVFGGLDSSILKKFRSLAGQLFLFSGMGEIHLNQSGISELCLKDLVLWNLGPSDISWPSGAAFWIVSFVAGGADGLINAWCGFPLGRMIIEIRGIQPGYSMQRGNVLTWSVRIQAGWWRLLHVTLVRKSWKSERNWAVFKSLVDWCLYGGILPPYFGLSLSLIITPHDVKSYEPTRRNGRQRLLKHCSSGVVFCSPKLRVMGRPRRCFHHLKVFQLWSSWNQWKRLVSRCFVLFIVPRANIWRPGNLEGSFGRFTHLTGPNCWK